MASGEKEEQMEREEAREIPRYARNDGASFGQKGKGVPKWYCGGWEKKNTICRCARVGNYKWLKEWREAVRRDRRKTGVNTDDFG